jgi:hypothetical protein
MRALDLLDYSFAIDGVRLKAKHVARKLMHAHDCGADCELALGALIPELTQIRDDLDTLIGLARGEEITMDISGLAVIEDGVIIIRLPIENLPAVVEGSWAAGGMDVRFKVTDTKAFAKDLVAELDREDDAGTTRIHKMFDGAIIEAISEGAEGIEKHDDQRF